MKNNEFIRGKFDPARETAFGDITNTFQRIGTEFEFNFGIVSLQNFTDVMLDISISFEGEDTVVSLAPQGTGTFDMSTNDLIIARGESAWVKYRNDAPSKGFVQVTTVSPA